MGIIHGDPVTPFELVAGKIYHIKGRGICKLIEQHKLGDYLFDNPDTGYIILTKEAAAKCEIHKVGGDYHEFYNVYGETERLGPFSTKDEADAAHKDSTKARLTLVRLTKNALDEVIDIKLLEALGRVAP